MASSGPGSGAGSMWNSKQWTGTQHALRLWGERFVVGRHREEIGARATGAGTGAGAGAAHDGAICVLQVGKWTVDCGRVGGSFPGSFVPHSPASRYPQGRDWRLAQSLLHYTLLLLTKSRAACVRRLASPRVRLPERTRIRGRQTRTRLLGIVVRGGR